jgi:hypothetical protein
LKGMKNDEVLKGGGLREEGVGIRVRLSVTER